MIFARYGGVDVLEPESYEPPPPGAGELAVDVAFAGVNYADVIARRGFYKWAPPPPTCVGFEVSGVVREVGPGVSGFSPGDRVLAVMRFGGYAERVVIEAARATLVPASMTLEEAAAIPAVYLTAWHALHESARVRKGESILIQAVAGGVGIAALQLAVHAGLVTYGTASTPEKLEVAKSLGLAHGIDYARCDFEDEIKKLTGGRGVDVVLDSLGGEGLRKGYRCLARGGRVVAIGAAQVAPSARRPRELLKAGIELARGGVYHPFGLIEDNRGILGLQILLYWDDVAHLRYGLDAVLALHAEGVVRPRIDSIVPLAEAGRAHERLETRKSTGKLLLRCSRSA
jgi:NADPH:quinone reductase-like Zn-dependent oxidoreductase